LICVYWLSVKKEALKPRMIASAYPFYTANVAIYMLSYYLIKYHQPLIYYPYHRKQSLIIETVIVKMNDRHPY